VQNINTQTGWNIVPCDYDFTLPNVISKKTNSQAIQYALAMALVDQYVKCIRMYTDGSRSAGGLGASVVCSPAIDYVEAVRLSNGTSIHTAELYAIIKAVGRITVAPVGSGPFAIFTDSLSAARALSSVGQGLDTDIILKLCQEIINIISNKNIVTIAWIPGHAGIPGNEAVDLLAKLALSHTTIQLVIKPTVPEYFARINNCINLKWQSQYDSNIHVIHYKIVQPSVS